MALKKSQKQTSSKALLGRLWRENVRQYLPWMVLAVFCMAIMAGATAISAWLMKPVVNDIFVSRREEMLMIIGASVLATFVIKGTANYAQSVLMAFVGLRIVADLQKRLYTHMTELDMTFFHNNSTGTLVSRFTVDVHAMRVTVSHAITVFGKDLLSLIGLVSVMFIQDAQLAAIAFIVFPVAVLPIVKIGRKMRRVTTTFQEETGMFTTLLEQTFQGIRVVKAYSMEPYEQKRIGELIDKLFKTFLKSNRARALNSPIMETLGGVAITLVIVYGGDRVINGDMDAGSFFSFITALLLAYEPMKRLANLNATVQEGLAGADRTFALLDRTALIKDKPQAKDLEPRGGEIKFENVSFSYPRNVETESRSTEPALKNISITVPAGKTVALVGASGAGKSTIMNLVPRFYEVDDGNIMVDGQNVRDITMKSLRGAMALVSQEITLFDDTVRANIAYGRQGASEEEIIEAARGASALDFISNLPDGFDTQVGEHGVKLSGGQRQRLAIARAMLKNAPILLLDEATSALDTESERNVQSALDKLMKNRTTLVIAHRLSTVVGADIIYVLDGGQVIEQGSHGQLVDKGGVYSTLYHLQFEDEDKQNHQ
ncbi:MAG: ABC transporter ATP-binding protein/permease [Rhodospirillaceae bacterium]|nr:ABC transporter ATP-binding protein/permease [Rhodospirillaceae bacterium]